MRLGCRDSLSDLQLHSAVQGLLHLPGSCALRADCRKQDYPGTDTSFSRGCRYATVLSMVPRCS